MAKGEEKRITSFSDLEVYRNSYKGCTLVMNEIIPNLPESEKYDLKKQLGSSCKAIPRLIAEGYAKRHQKFGFQKYLDDAMAECNETIVGMEMCKDFFGKYVNKELCLELIDLYDKCGRQLYKLREAWGKFSKKRT